MNVLNNIVTVFSKPVTSNSILQLYDIITKFKETTDGQEIFLVGSGRSLLVAKMFAMRLMHLGFDVNVIGEVTTRRIGPNDLMIGVSNSGETNVVINALEKASCVGADIVIITSKEYMMIDGTICKNTLTLLHEENKTTPMGTLFELSAAIMFDTVISMFIKDHPEINYKYNHTNLE